MHKPPKQEVNMNNIAALISVISFLTISLSFFLKVFIFTSYTDELNMRFFEPYLMNSGNYVVLIAAVVILIFCVPVVTGAGSAIWIIKYQDQTRLKYLSSDLSIAEKIFYSAILVTLSVAFVFFFYFSFTLISTLLCFASIAVIYFWFSRIKLAEILSPDFSILNRLWLHFDLRMNKSNGTNSPSNLDSKNDNLCSITFRKICADIYLIPPVFFQIYAILIPFVFVPGSRLGIERIQILNSFFISIISIMLPSIIAIWSFTYTKRYYDNDTLKWLLFGVSTPIVFVFFFLAITSKFYSQFSERVIFESNLGFYQIQFIND